MTETKDLATLIREYGITAAVEYGAPSNSYFGDSDPWTVTLRFGRRRMTVPFYMGYGHNGREPLVGEVLECLLSDANASEDGLEEFCANLGLDADSRKAERTYKACVRTAKRLQQFLGNEYETFIYAER